MYDSIMILYLMYAYHAYGRDVFKFSLVYAYTSNVMYLSWICRYDSCKFYIMYHSTL